MNNEEILQNVLNITIQRIGKQITSYESEIANLNAQIIVLTSQIDEFNKQQAKERPAKVKPLEDS